MKPIYGTFDHYICYRTYLTLKATYHRRLVEIDCPTLSQISIPLKPKDEESEFP